jgi:hypothetical protein
MAASLSAVMLSTAAAHGQTLGHSEPADVYGPLGSEIVATPNKAEVTAAWPGGEGSAVAHCKAQPSGAVADCQTSLERGKGAAAALIALAPKFRLKLPPGAASGDVVITASWPVPDTAADWQVPPKAGDFMTTSTAAAWHFAGDGLAVMNCLEGKLGTLYQCVVVYQDPPGKGFGTMLLRFPAYLKLKPAYLAGKPVNTGVNFAMRFEKAAPGAIY